MTILFAGGEDTSFTGSVLTSTNTGFRRTAYSRETVFPTSNTSVTDPMTNRLVSPTFTAGNLLWFHAQVATFGTTCLLNLQSMLFRSPDGVSRIVVRQTSTSGIVKISSRNAAGTIVDLATASGGFTSSTVSQLDLRIDYSSTGGVQMWINNVQVVNYVGDPRTDSATQLNQVELAHFDNAGQTAWSEVIVADQDTRGMALWTLVPQAAGNTQSWTPNTVGNINDVTISDATFVSTGTINALSEWTVPTSVPSGTWNIAAVVQEARVLVGTLSPLHFDWLTRVGGTDYLSGAPAAPTTIFSNFHHQWPTNPNTGSAWTVSDVTAVGFNLGIESQT